MHEDVAVLLVLLQAVKASVALNWQMFCGCIQPDYKDLLDFDPVQFNASFAARFSPYKKQALGSVGAFKVGFWVAPFDHSSCKPTLHDTRCALFMSCGVRVCKNVASQQLTMPLMCDLHLGNPEYPKQYLE